MSAPRHDRWVWPAHSLTSPWAKRCWRRIFGAKKHALLHGRAPNMLYMEWCMIQKQYLMDGLDVVQIRANDPREPL